MIKYKAMDAIGRIWEVSEDAVVTDYIKYLMQADCISQYDATTKAYEHGFPEFWWYEQMLPYPELVMVVGVMVKDVSDEHKKSLLNRLARQEMESYEN